MKALLVADDAPELRTAQATDRSLRKRDMTVGAMLMFVSALLVAVVTIDMPPSHSARVFLVVIVWLILTLLINITPILRYLLNADASSHADRSSLSRFLPGFTSHANPEAHNSVLSSPQSAAVADLSRRPVNTADIVQPPSITEHTTNLLGENRSSVIHREPVDS